MWLKEIYANNKQCAWQTSLFFLRRVDVRVVKMEGDLVAWVRSFGVESGFIIEFYLLCCMNFLGRLFLLFHIVLS